MQSGSVSFGSFKEGSVTNILQFLTLDQSTGHLIIGFGDNLPKAYVNLVSGKVTTAEFGAITGDQVLCLLLCQEGLIKSMDFVHDSLRGNAYDKSKAVSDPGLSRALLRIATGLDKCTARPQMFGSQDIEFEHSGKRAAVLQVLHDFDMVNGLFKTEPAVTFAPVHQCAIFNKALKSDLVKYSEMRVEIDAIKEMLALLSPLPETDKKIVSDAVGKALPHCKADSMKLEDFFELADLLEALSQERGKTCSDSMQFKIFTLIGAKTELDILQVAQLRQSKLLQRLARQQAESLQKQDTQATTVPPATQANSPPQTSAPVQPTIQAVLDDDLTPADTLPVVAKAMEQSIVELADSVAPNTQPGEAAKASTSIFKMFFNTKGAIKDMLGDDESA